MSRRWPRGTRTLPTGSRYGIVAALRQSLEAAVRWELISTNPAKRAGSNPQPKREEVEHFEPDEIERLAEELGLIYGPLVIVAAFTGLRPSGGRGSSGDVDRQEGVLRVERAFSYGQVKAVKTKGSRRRVPLPARAAAALELVPRRLDRRLVFPGPRGAQLSTLRNWRKREWKPALEAAGLPTTPTVRPAPLPLRCRMLAAGVRLRRRPLHGHERPHGRPHLRPPRLRIRAREVKAGRLDDQRKRSLCQSGPRSARPSDA